MNIKKTSVKTTLNTSKKGVPVAKPVVNARQESKHTSATAPAAKTAAPKIEAPSSERNGVNIGQVTGLRVMAFQDATLATNDLPKRPAPLGHIPTHLTDTELAKVWRAEFPNSRAVLNGRINEDIVRGVRNLYNQGTGGHGTAGQTHQSKPYVLGADNKRVVSEYTRVRKTAEAGAQPAAPKAKVSPEASTAATKAVAKKAAKVVTAQAAKAVVKKVVKRNRAA